MNNTGRSEERERVESTQTEDASFREDASSGESTDYASAKLRETATKDATQQNSASTNTAPSKSVARSAASMSTEDDEIKHTEPSSPITADLSLAAGLQNRIGAQLQSLYNDVLTEETPDRFLRLLEELDRESPPR